MKATRSRLLRAGSLAAVVVLVTALPASATSWAVTLHSGSSAEAQSGSVSETITSPSCNSGNPVTTLGQACTGNLLPNAGASASTVSITNGTVPSAYALAATNCGFASVNDYSATTTAAHGNFTAASYGVAGPKSGSSSVQFDGSTTWLATGGPAVAGPQSFTLLAWFKFPSTAAHGGAIMGFQTSINPSSATTQTNGHWDRQLWLNDSGKLSAGANPVSPTTVSSSGTYKDNTWHLAAVTESGSTLTLYVDGSSVASAATTGAEYYSGWWSVGAATLANFSNLPTLSGSGVGYFNGDLAGVAVLSSVLTQAQISTLYSDSSIGSYTSGVESYSVLHYWSLQDSAPTPSSASTATLPGQLPSLTGVSENGNFPDFTGKNNTAYSYGGVSSSSDGPLSSGASTTFDGSTGYLQTSDIQANPEGFSIVAWFKTTSKSGTIIGFGDQQSDSGVFYKDRQLWVDNSGNVVFGVYPGTVQEATSSGTNFADGAWHMVVAEVSAAGVALDVDNKGFTTNTSGTSGQSYNGYWHIGWDSEQSWNDAPSDYFFNGSIAGVAIIPSVLTTSNVNTLYTSGAFSTYSSNVTALSPTSYWPLQYAAATYPDLSGSLDDAIGYGGVTASGSGPLSSGSATTLDGSSGYLTTPNAISDPENFSVVAWFNIASGHSGTIFSFSTSANNFGPPTHQDRELWVDNSGKLNFGVWAGSSPPTEVTSASSYADGAWHMAVAEIGSSGVRISVDGSTFVANTAATSAQSYTGYWHIGWGAYYYWTNGPSDVFFQGSVAGVAVIPTQLSQPQISALHSAANFNTYSGTVINDGPSEYWPLTQQANACSAAVATVAVTTGGTTTCILPPLASGTACPAVATGGLPLVDLTTLVVPTTISVAKSATVTLTINVADNGALPSALSATDVLEDATVLAEDAADTAWAASGVYSGSQAQL